MLKLTTPNAMLCFLREAYPAADGEALQAMTLRFIRELNEELDALVCLYTEKGTKTEYTHGEFTLSLIMGIRKCNYPTAVLLMDSYMKDPCKGKQAILSR